MFIKQIKGSLFKANTGSGLIEVMIAVLILGVGMLGILALQRTALQFNQRSYYYSQASILTNEITEKIRAARGFAENYSLSYGDTPGAADDACIVNACSDRDFATWNLSVWKRRIERIFPDGDARIAVNPGNKSTVIVRFNIDGANDNPQLVSTEFVIYD